jgi:uncharacterized membrane protein HdeD (DUF308 family)
MVNRSGADIVLYRQSEATVLKGGSMAEQQSSKVTESAKAALPWRKGLPWFWILVEGILMLAIGLFMVLAQEQARVAFGVILAAALTISGALQLLAA